MPLDESKDTLGGKKIRFKTPARVLFTSESKIDDLLRNDKEAQEGEAKKERSPSLASFLQVELTRDYLLEHDEERFSARREKVYSFMRIPREVERFMRYGFMQCTDSFLFVYTFLPMRVLLALWALVTRPFSQCFGVHDRGRRVLTPAEICDLLKAVILVTCSMIMFSVDTNMLYHLIKSQSVIKLYIFYNMLEVGDRLFSAFGQDTIDALFWTATEPRGRKREHLGVIPHLIFAIVYVILHSILVLFQATTLNVAINSNNKALLTIMMSNNFVELKGSVFKKFDKNNLFQVSCSDVRERFHLIVLLSIVVLQTMREYSWKWDRLWVLVPDCLIVLIAEMFVDWIKHAFITRFNELQLDVYRDYTTSLAYDMAQTRQKHAFSDHSDLVARRMGFIPLPLGVVMIRVLVSAIHINDFASVILFILAYFCLGSFKVLNSLLILGKACDLIAQHKQEKATVQSPNSKTTTTATSPLRPPVVDQPVRYSNGFPPVEIKADLGPAAIFANSTVDLKNVSLNEELLKVEGEDIKIEPALEQGEIVTRSFPDINSKELEDIGGDGLKRAESEPSLNICSDESDLPK
ncbi:protein TAPT1 homolog [Tribolium castaneum]|uniref:Protein TAPT1 homolog-like Protein n=1 Tax=Tribolium castaneum TaxID=7070 RepID=A0A139WNU1_TRICA|nr:PREDICTED: protein TAPT1 homolog [Tribolium castaneum]KYB29435.1 Protein TAPT1 homolog-like Protein [Tribolium castaneum]|eukprot:XP_971007.1 PREDICTED: protein TAPT1 homolog [Tribolium castaneum]